MANAKNNTTTSTPETTAALQTKHLAQRFGMRPQQLRRVLRSMTEYADGVHTKYRWDPATDKAKIDAIAAAIAAIAKKKEEAKAKAAAALKAKAEEAKKQAELDKKAA